LSIAKTQKILISYASFDNSGKRVTGMKKRAQLSIFVIIGIVILASFMLVVFLSSSVGKDKIQQQIASISKQKNALASINSNEQSCLKYAADSALTLAGKQGGFIFNFQGGLADSSKVSQNEKGVYWILRDALDNPPEYPRYPNFVGIPQIPVLKKESTGLPSRYPAVKDELEKYSAYQFGQCMNLSQFEALGVEIQQLSNPSITVAFGESDTIFYLTYPIKITIGSSSQKKTTAQSYSSGVRFLSIYTIAKNLAYDDLNPNFMFTPEIVNQQRYNPLKADVAITVSPGPDYDIITLTDAKKKIGQDYYHLVFLRQNRNPILRRIQDITVNILDNINITADVTDPDEDKVAISVNKTKEQFYGGELRHTIGSMDSHSGDFSRFLNFKAEAKDIGYYTYNITATDEGNLKDWQEIRVFVKCEYKANVKMEGAQWKDSDSGRTFSYNPLCCEKDYGLKFNNGTRVTLSDGSTCTCNENGGCEGMMPPTYTCTEKAGQTCEAGTTCPADKEPGTGTCESGETCCKQLEREPREPPCVGPGCA